MFIFLFHPDVTEKLLTKMVDSFVSLGGDDAVVKMILKYFLLQGIRIFHALHSFVWKRYLPEEFAADNTPSFEA
jgi:DUF1009 family protein